MRITDKIANKQRNQSAPNLPIIGILFSASIVLTGIVQIKSYQENTKKFQDTYATLTEAPTIHISLPEQTSNLKLYFKSMNVDIESPQGKAVLYDFEQMNKEKICGYAAPYGPTSPDQVPVPCMKPGLYRIHDFKTLDNKVQNEKR